jgi:membrane dipeptidase
MRLNRRSVLAGAAAVAAAAPAIAQRAVKHAGWYRNAILIDGLGGINDPYAPNDQLRLSDRAWAEYRMTGLTAVRDTMLPVGNRADSWEQFQKSLDDYHTYFGANPDRLKLVETAADILAA